MEFEEFISDLIIRLKKELPGQQAQRLMAPFESNQDRFNLDAQSEAISGAVLILFYPDGGGIHFPLIQRPTYNGVHSDQVALPGGKKEIEDVDLYETALREANEEIGIELENLTIIGSLTELYIPVSNFKVLPAIGYCSEKPAFVPDDHEVEEIIIANVEMLKGRDMPQVTEIVINDNFQLKAPYFAVDDHIIWGATAMMLGELQVLLND